MQTTVDLPGKPNQ